MNYITIISLAAVVIGLTTTAAHAQDNFVVHEWGTFTSVQGGDGKLLLWHPLQTSELPSFVHQGFIPKSGFNGPPALQRMETPVIYFYTGKNLNVDVGVNFPKGIITEWYPRTTQTNSSAMAGDHAAWKNLKLIASAHIDSKLDDLLPQLQSGSRYYAAREPDSDFVQTEAIKATNTMTETEKFIFYRGLGYFNTPLQTGVDDNNVVTVQNNGGEEIARLFLVSIHGKQGAFVSMGGLPSKASVAWQSLDPGALHPLPLEQFQTQIVSEMKTALIHEGLFPQEAQAMVDTWRDSWFAEGGDRVLYLLPRTWTDETLPLTIEPKPPKLVRVMVGRAEILAPSVEQHLLDSLVSAANGGSDDHKAVISELKSFGRFSGPALRLASTENSSTNVQMLGDQLLFQSEYSGFK